MRLSCVAKSVMRSSSAHHDQQYKEDRDALREKEAHLHTVQPAHQSNEPLGDIRGVDTDCFPMLHLNVRNAVGQNLRLPP